MAVITAPTGLPAPTVARILVQPDQKIVLAGSNAASWTFCRMLADGKPDPSYGTGGVARVVLAADQFFSDAVLSGTALYGVGGVRLGASVDRTIVIFRLDATGNLDTTFGVGGIVDTGRKTVSDVRLLRIALAPGNKLVVSGESNVLRYSVSGSLDATFGQAGLASVPMAASGSRPLTVEANGHIVVGGADGLYRIDPDGQSARWGEVSVIPRVVVARGQALWFLDQRAGQLTSESVDPDVGSYDHTFADSVAMPPSTFLTEGLLDANRRWVSIFETTAGSHGVAVTRTKADFSGYDPTFGKSGQAVLGLQLVPVAAALAPDGRILVASHAGSVLRIFP